MASAVMHSVFSKPVNHILGACVFTSDRIRLRVGKGHYAEETDRIYGMRRKCDAEERSHVKEDIRKPVLPFVGLLLGSHRIHFLFTWSFYFLSKSFVTAHDSTNFRKQYKDIMKA